MAADAIAEPARASRQYGVGPGAEIQEHRVNQGAYGIFMGVG